MTDTEHLQRIKAKCQELLAIAEKRTAGRWKCGSDTVWDWDGNEKVADCDGWNPDFIAACAGAAEAGWLSTIAAIDDCLNVDSSLPIYIQNITTEMMLTANARLVAAIIAAWPEEIL
jgi:hypothetical protein